MGFAGTSTVPAAGDILAGSGCAEKAAEKLGRPVVALAGHELAELAEWAAVLLVSAVAVAAAVVATVVSA